MITRAKAETEKTDQEEEEAEEEEQEEEDIFPIYIDPSGYVRTVDGAPLTGATVTLLRADAAGGPFSVVPTARRRCPRATGAIPTRAKTTATSAGT